ncbi:hypothetical protein NUH88_19320 [Nisaea acidiphila]|uniref:Uncharacterized protein n=1 Tax=Nisaea acidiphila TaxID=1862145 RepID=A0A9J7AQ62_9PROT|nr:hypothetical protein [Nisaea acidiphila]UUX49536.1 hypothetical protein NUH88_19320 [Nisaea acidiphila]
MQSRNRVCSSVPVSALGSPIAPTEETTMSDAPTDPPLPLILDLVEWVAATPRLYSEVMEAWRTSCPRLTVWEEAVDRGLVARRHVAGTGAMVEATRSGRAALAAHGRT